VGSYSDEIWKLFGKDRRTYIQRDVFSDDEDMEVDAGILEREELRRSVVLLACRIAPLMK
jgi:protein SPT2